MLKLLPFEHTGKKSSNTLIIFLHGFPDSIRLWDNLLNNLSDQDAQFLNISYPNYHIAENQKYGSSLIDLVKRIKYTVDYIVDNRKLKKIFVTHDWGSYLGYVFDQEYPKYIDDMVALDVGPDALHQSSQYLLQIVMYQIFFAFCFVIGLIPYIGNFMGTMMASFYMKYLMKLNSQSKLVKSSMCYLYFYVWLNYIISKITFNENRLYLKKNYIPSTSVIYIYGTKKPFQFHSSNWQVILRKNKNSEFIAANTGHWIMKQDQYLVTTKVLQTIKKANQKNL